MKFILNKKFYNIEAVKESLNDFKEVCNGKILNENIEVELIPKEEIANLEKEFCNYVLGLMKNKSMV
jgi:hypothetical protein